MNKQGAETIVRRALAKVSDNPDWIENMLDPKYAGSYEAEHEIVQAVVAELEILP